MNTIISRLNKTRLVALFSRVVGWPTRIRLLNPVTDEQLKKFHLAGKQQVERIHQHLIKTEKLRESVERPSVFVAVHQVNWENQGLVASWAEVADIIQYDWGDSFDQYAPYWHEKGKPAFNKQLIRQVQLAHREKPIDLFFSYLSGRWVYPETIRAISRMGLITVNISFDDTIKFWGYRELGGLSGMAEIAPEFDICITSTTPKDVSKYVAVGANPLFLPPAGNPSIFSVPPASKDISVSFVGQAHGRRPKVIEYLRAQGIPVQTFGKGWPSGELSLQEMRHVYGRSLINLGFGYTGHSAQPIGLNGRDFELPLTGAFYLTTYCPELEGCFVIGKEIDCYRNEGELVDKIKFYLANPDLALKIGAAGRTRCLRDHTWERRFRFILEVAGLVACENCEDRYGSAYDGLPRAKGEECEFSTLM